MRVDIYAGAIANPNCHSATTLIDSFKEYRLKGFFWAFGRDVPYHRPPKMTEYSIKHIHIISSKKYRQYQSDNVRLYDRTSDKHIVYARSPFDDDHYLLIAIINPEAHNTSEDMNLMHQLYEICRNHFG